ncbi:MAG: hypothetical protein IPO91_32885 [Chloroflexi bacterium]|nr:hypothetical protein [Chloroflexota bacterium]
MIWKRGACDDGARAHMDATRRGGASGTLVDSRRWSQRSGGGRERYRWWREWGGLWLRAGVAIGADYIHYVDADRLVRWHERLPDELAQTVEQLSRADFTAIGRTPAAFATSLATTEQLTSDAGHAGSGFSLAAARFILQNSQPIRPMGTDAEWAVLAWRGGFSIQSVEVEGLDWESADQYQDKAADEQQQAQVAEAYDAKPTSWAFRVRVANEVIEAGLEALTRPLLEVKL